MAILLSQGALAGDIADKATQAETLLGSGDAAAALEAFEGAVDAYWKASPLVFRVAKFADSVTGFSVYAPRATGAFHAGDTINIYLEPVGYGFIAIDDGYRVSFHTGIEIHQGDIILGKTDDFGQLTSEARDKNYAVYAAVSVKLPDLKAGDYQLLLTLSDDASGKLATTTFPFTIE